MRLYHSPLSPFVRKIMVALIETDMIGKVELVTGSGTPIDPGTAPIEANPLGKVPALEIAPGRVLYDSRLITRWIDAESGGSLYPSGDALWDALIVESTVEGALDAALLMSYERRLRPEELRFAPWVEGQWTKVARALDTIETRWLGGMPPDRATMPAIALGCALGYLDFRFDERGWRDGRPALTAWYETFATRPSMLETLPKQ
ncbi:glutathione S-transferase family protein [Frigidibacter sp. MR17.24]|uniref:glutathione S-transferase family protein n=1 Tax=Frigidibacter sp. MR17.24 TaxID=3127345 RepID=UPI003012E365